ncbi:hypothetical protein PLICRDRAFT_141287 [Plicaturopsis crispa FD-325 SS-3]|nr:hypothetical protein PLICRDRAFT_141287 [Plicaturopsis crispa FD-325 SS-3]
MGGPNLEIFKFGLYLFVPVFALVHFGDPQWYHDNVLPYKEKLFPPESRTINSVPTHQAAVREEIERFKAEKRARKLERELAEQNASKPKLV